MDTKPGRSEAEIVAACKRGARWARRALFEQHHRAIYRFLVAHGSDPSVAEDLVQETFLRAYRAIPRFRGDARVGSWLMRIALNCLYEVSRRGETARRKIEQAQGGDPRPGWAIAGGATAGRQHEQRDLLLRALARLDSDEASIVLLHDLQGYRYREIADSLQIAVGTVGSRLHRARSRLRRAIEELAETVEETSDAAPPTNDRATTGTGSKPNRTPPGVAGGVAWSER